MNKGHKSSLLKLDLMNLKGGKKKKKKFQAETKNKKEKQLLEVENLLSNLSLLTATGHGLLQQLPNLELPKIM